MKSFEDYYTATQVTAQDPTAEAYLTIKAIIFFGIRLQTTFMSNKGFYHKLGFMTMEEIIEQYREAPMGYPSPLKINYQSDLAWLGMIRELAFTLIPSDPARTIPPYGAKYNTAVPYASALNMQTVITDIYAFDFEFGTGGLLCHYRVAPGTIKAKKSRKTTPHFA